MKPFALIALLVGAAAGSAEAGGTASLPELMPRVGDYTSMWWVDGFPGSVEGAPWQRCIQTGSYAMVLDTENLGVPHFGPVAPGTGYAACGRGAVPAWRDLPAAELGLRITVDGRSYRCTEGGKWGRFTGPRLIESGRFFQRADVTDLVFRSADGERLDVEARLETAAWPDRLGLILAARPGRKAIAAGEAGVRKAGEPWKNAAMEISLRTAQGELRGAWKSPADRPGADADWQEVHLALNPATFRAAGASSPVLVKASEFTTGEARPVEFDAARGWHRVNLDGIEPILPAGDPERANDAMERVRLVLSNPTAHEQTARLMFEKDRGGIRQRIGAAITGMSAILRDAQGRPTGIPVQLSKNWHNEPEGGVYIGPWFHGLSQVRLPAASSVELELSIVYGHWGGVAAASHAQLSLVGWGSNQRWDESALGAWGESICYEPDQVQARCSILDVRPLMVDGMNGGGRWRWTSNVGGGDCFRWFDPVGKRVAHAAMRAAYQRYGPCLTEVTYSGRIGRGIGHSLTASLGRSDDLVRGSYRLRLDVREPADFSRLVIFQVGADTYNYTSERKMALGNENGLLREWEAQWGGDAYRTEPVECSGRVPWLSLHQAAPRSKKGEPGAWANRGLVIRSWKARLGGKPAAPWVAERGVSIHGTDSSTLDILPPPGVTRLEPGDFVDATVEYVVMPQFAGDYYGPNEQLRAALMKSENTWRMIHREALGNERRVEVAHGTLEQLHPDVRVRSEGGKAGFTLSGGLGHVPVTFTGLPSSSGHTLIVDGKALDQGVHGNDFWQTDYDPATRLWSRTYNIPVSDGRGRSVELIATP